jgi:hypothetical protein
MRNAMLVLSDESEAPHVDDLTDVTPGERDDAAIVSAQRRRTLCRCDCALCEHAAGSGAGHCFACSRRRAVGDGR